MEYLLSFTRAYCYHFAELCFRIILRAIKSHTPEVIIEEACFSSFLRPFFHLLDKWHSFVRLSAREVKILIWLQNNILYTFIFERQRYKKKYLLLYGLHPVNKDLKIVSNRLSFIWYSCFVRRKNTMWHFWKLKLCWILGKNIHMLRGWKIKVLSWCLEEPSSLYNCTRSSI